MAVSSNSAKRYKKPNKSFVKDSTDHSLLKSIKSYFKKRMNVWLTKRIPAAQSHQLSNRNIFIFPSAFGFGYLAFVLLVFILGTNYQNNLIMLLAYLLASFFITVMMHSFYNFSQLGFSVQPQQTGFAQQKIAFPLTIHSKKIHFDLNFKLDNKLSPADDIKLAQSLVGDTRVNLPYINSKRGKHTLGRVTIFSEYSFGLFKTWTHLDFGLTALIYPKPLPLVMDQSLLSGQQDESAITSYQSSNRVGMDEFSELKSYILGESRARTAWKQLARGQGHYSKHYQESQSALVCLDLANMPAGDIEIQLSYLSFLVTELTQSQQMFSLQLEHNKESIAYSSGLAHQQACLTALALYHV